MLIFYGLCRIHLRVLVGLVVAMPAVEGGPVVVAVFLSINRHTLKHGTVVLRDIP